MTPGRETASSGAAGQSVSYLGVDIGGTRVKWSLVDRNGRCLDSGDEATPTSGGEALVDLVVDIARRQGAAARAVGLAVPGLVNTRSRETLFIPNVAGRWGGYPLGRRVGDALGKPVVVLNDARAFGYAELRAGAARARPSSLFMTLGTGIGGAVARDAEVVLDELDCFPELGHLVVQHDGQTCGCGATGCLETVASASALAGQGTRAAVEGHSPTLVELCGGRTDEVTARTVARAADLGDPWATGALRRAGTYLGMAAANGCLLLGSRAVVIGGGMADAFPHFAPAVRRVLEGRASLIGSVEVVKAQLGSRAGSIGAALYGRDTAEAPATALDSSHLARNEKAHAMD